MSKHRLEIGDLSVTRDGYSRDFASEPKAPGKASGSEECKDDVAIAAGTGLTQGRN